MKPLRHEVVRYIVNGLVATAVHYGVLTLNLEVLKFDSAGLANLVAAIFGISCSFVGSKWFVFSGSSSPLGPQILKFGLLYGAIALLHGLTLLLWSDWLKFDYTLGFLIATLLQVAFSYWGNKLLVFKT
jgi:putative flippase GtrA